MEPGQNTLDELLRELPWLRRLATAMVGGERADDVVQDTFAAALDRRRAGAAWTSPRAWLATVLRNRVRRLARREAQRREVEDHYGEVRAAAEVTGSRDDAAELLARADLHRALVEEVTSLPADQRLVVLLRCFEELDFAAVAARAGIGVEAARSRYRRALATLRARLDERSGGRAAWVALLVPRVPPVPSPVSGSPVSAAQPVAVLRAVPLAGLGLAGAAAVALVLSIAPGPAATTDPLAAAAPAPVRTAGMEQEARQATAASPARPPEHARSAAEDRSRQQTEGPARRTRPRAFVAVSASASASASASVGGFPGFEEPRPERSRPDLRTRQEGPGPGILPPVSVGPEVGAPSGTDLPLQLALRDGRGLPLGGVDLQVLPASLSAAVPGWDAAGNLPWSGRTGDDGTVLLPWASAASGSFWLRVRGAGGWTEVGRVAARGPGCRVSCRVETADPRR